MTTIVVVMRSNDPDDIIEHLKAQAAAAVDGRTVVHESENMNASVREQFWRHVVEFETAGTTPMADKAANSSFATTRCATSS